jgi:hypothetical protein
MEKVDVWQVRFDSVDKAIERSKSKWALEYWTTVRKRLVRNMQLSTFQRYQ